MSASKWAYMPAMCDGRECPGDCDMCSFVAERMLEQINRALEMVEENGARADSICMNRRTIEQLRKLATYPVGAYIRNATLCGLSLYVNNTIPDGDFIMYRQALSSPIKLFNGEGLYGDEEAADEE